jgi:hypothetical protein
MSLKEALDRLKTLGSERLRAQHAKRYYDAAAGLHPAGVAAPDFTRIGTLPKLAEAPAPAARPPHEGDVHYQGQELN